MQIRKIKVAHFRGIESLDWKPGSPFCCLIGPGDSGKSTVLDAVEAALSSRWFAFTEPDFLACDTTRPIVIEATVGELSKALKSDERLGLYVRGWTSAGELHDEPEDDDEPVLTVRLTVDASMEPVWELICDRVDDPRTLSNRDRALFGLVRLAGEDARHLAWGQGSVLSRLTGDTHEASARLAQAYKAARENAKLDEIESLANAAEKAEGFAKGLGAYVEGSYEPGLELGRSGLSSGSIALHDDGVPLRLAGLGTRRLATLAIQKSAISEGAIVLVDEIEHGLEPHRIIGAIAQLKADQEASVAAARPVGQVLMTTHSDVAVGETGPERLRVVQMTRPGRQAAVLAPTAPDPIAQAPAMALALHELGFQTAIFRDSDTTLSPAEQASLAAAGIQIFEYGGDLNTEQAIFGAASDDLVQELLNFAREERGNDAIDNNIDIKIPDLTLAVIRETFSAWELFSELDGPQLREAIAEVAVRKKWFKDQRIGRGLSPMVWRIAEAAPGSLLATALRQAEAWLYA